MIFSPYRHRGDEVMYLSCKTAANSDYANNSEVQNGKEKSVV